MVVPRWQARQLGIQARKLGSPRPKAFELIEPPKEVILMRVREAILHSERQPDGAVTMARIVSTGHGHRLIQIVQTKANQATQVTLDAKEYRALVAFCSGKKR